MAKKKNIKAPQISILNGLCSWDNYSIIDYSYERSRCHCSEDYCRCTQIVSTKINSFDYKLFISKVIKLTNKHYELSEIGKYALYKLIQFQNISKEDFEVNVCAGYYGEEVNGFNFQKASELEVEIKKIIDLSDLEKIKYILKLEYGYLLPVLESISTAEIKTIKLSSIKLRQDDPINYVEIKDCSEFYGVDYTYPRAILFANFLVDGNHRMFEAKKLKLQEVPVIILQ